MADPQAQDGALGEELVQVGVGVAGWFLGLVLGIDDGGRARSRHYLDIAGNVLLKPGIVWRLGRITAAVIISARMSSLAGRHSPRFHQNVGGS